MPGCTTSRCRAEVDAPRAWRAGTTSCTGRPGEPAHQTAPGDAAQHVVVAESDAVEAAADQGGADVADDGFDFGKLGHCAGNVNGRCALAGNSGEPRRLAPADVPAEHLALELDRLRASRG